MSDNNIWYLPGPFHRYEQDVKALAKEAGLRIIDANVTESRDGECENPPKVTLKELPAQLVVVVAGDDKAAMEELLGKLQAESAAIRVLIDGLESGSVDRPESGELALSLFEALTRIHSSMSDLAESRDELARKRDILLAEVEALKKAETERAEKAAKAKPDAKQPADKAAPAGESK